MTRLELLAGVAMFVGATLVVSLLPWFGRRSLVARLRPYAPGGMGVSRAQDAPSAQSLRDIVGPLARTTGQALARAFGVDEDIAVRLRRARMGVSVTEFRTRQLAHALMALIGALLLSALIRLPIGPAFVLALAAPLVAFLVIEQRVTVLSQRRQRRLFLELPVVAEQIGMLLAAGYSLGAALQRIASRGNGVAAQDLRDVVGRSRHGLSEMEALREWAELARVDALDRLVSVLALNREATDLGALISDEARTIRRDAHRDLLETIERRDQQVWIPVTVAALVPGSILIGIPFIQAMRTFTNAG